MIIKSEQMSTVKNNLSTIVHNLNHNANQDYYKISTLIESLVHAFMTYEDFLCTERVNIGNVFIYCVSDNELLFLNKLLNELNITYHHLNRLMGNCNTNGDYKAYYKLTVTFRKFIELYNKIKNIHDKSFNFKHEKCSVINVNNDTFNIMNIGINKLNDTVFINSFVTVHKKEVDEKYSKLTDLINNYKPKFLLVNKNSASLNFIDNSHKDENVSLEFIKSDNTSFITIKRELSNNNIISNNSIMQRLLKCDYEYEFVCGNWLHALYDKEDEVGCLLLFYSWLKCQ